MARVARQDVASLRSPRTTAAGYLRADAFIARVGIQEYSDGAGGVRRELRLPDEVFDGEALESFVGVPVTDDHPGAMLDTQNARAHARGNVSTPRADGNFVRADVLVTDADLIAKMKSGKTQLSCGYSCDLDETPGVWRGQQYDATQRNIRGNHVAVVDRGRAGPDVCARMDALDQEIDARTGATAREGKETRTMKKIVIDGVEYEVTEQVAQALEKDRTAREGREKQSKADADKAQATADAAVQKLAAETAARKDAEDPQKVQSKVNARVALVSVASQHLDKGFKFDGKTDREVKVAVIEKLASGTKLDGKSDEYVEARFDAAVGDVGAKALDVVREVADKAGKADASDKVEKARTDNEDDARNRWQKRIPGSVCKEKE